MPSTGTSSPAWGSTVETSERLLSLLGAAARFGILREVSNEDAESWRAEWIEARARLSGRALVASAPPVTRRNRGKPCAALLAPGAWIRIDGPSGPLEGEVLGVVLPGQSVADVVGEARMPFLDRRCHPHWGRPLARVAVLVPAGLRSRATVKLLYLGAVEARGSLLVAPPLLGPSRLPSPLSAGQPVAWRWHSRHGACSYQGRIVAFLPAFTSIAALGLQVRKSIHDVSRQDRYLVQPDGMQRVIAPPAYIIEEALCSMGGV